jgi:hypothetical protein
MLYYMVEKMHHDSANVSLHGGEADHDSGNVFLQHGINDITSGKQYQGK